MIITREEALKLLNEHIQNPRMIQHCLSSEAVMRALARRLGEDEDRWGLAGLLHDIDVEYTNADPYIHGIVGSQWLEEMGIDEDIVDAIRMHNEMATQKPRTTVFQHALAAGETITGLINATALVYPNKDILLVKPKSIIKRMKEKAFAASVKRENIMECEAVGLNLEEFVTIALEAMQSIPNYNDLNK